MKIREEITGDQMEVHEDTTHIYIHTSNHFMATTHTYTHTQSLYGHHTHIHISSVQFLSRVQLFVTP